MGQACFRDGSTEPEKRPLLRERHQGEREVARGKGQTASDYDDLDPAVRSKYGLFHQKMKTVLSSVARVERGEGGQKYVNQYLMCGPVLGRGSCSKVKRVLNTNDGLFYAIKILNKVILQKRKIVLENGKLSSQWQNVKREIAIMRRLRHPTVVRLYEVIDDPLNDKLFLVMEYAVKGSVLDGNQLESEPIPEEICRGYCRDIVTGLEYLHENHVVHRDIKPENLLIGNDGFIKLADFGVSTEFGASDLLHTTAGSAAFMAPEICQSTFESFSGKAADIWSLGVTLYVFLYGRLPFRAVQVYQMCKDICEKPLSFPDEREELKEREEIKESKETNERGETNEREKMKESSSSRVSEPCKDLLRRLMAKDPMKRITIAEIKQHPWLTASGTEPMAQAYSIKQTQTALLDSDPDPLSETDLSLSPDVDDRGWGSTFGLNNFPEHAGPSARAWPRANSVQEPDPQNRTRTLSDSEVEVLKCQVPEPTDPSDVAGRCRSMSPQSMPASLGREV